MSDATKRDERSGQVLESVTTIADLPRGGYPIDARDSRYKLSIDDLDKVAIWSVNPRGGTELGKCPVWIIVGSDFVHDIKFYALRRAVAKAGFNVEKVVLADKSFIRIAQAPQESEAETITQRNDLTDFYETMVDAALRERVSDIHIELRKTTAVVRMRKHGQMMLYKEIPTKFCRDLCTVIYNVLAETKDVTFMPNEYQAAAVNTRIKGEEVKLRYQSLPVYPDGFDVVLRVLPIGGDDEGTPDISVLGYSPSQVQDMMKIVSRPVGALIIAGTTGSGKSTTLKNLLMLINESRGYRCKIYTIEDPPEYKIPKVSQIPVVRRRLEDYTKKSPFQDPLVAAMRGDPDILMIGEIRDVFTGDGLKKATQSGHQVLTTLHSSSALGSVERLADFTITPSVMGSPEFINGLIYQKLMPLLCEHCALPFLTLVESSHATPADVELSRRLSQVANLNEDPIKVRNPKGCEKCKQMGVAGRTVCAEVVVPDFVMLRLFREQKSIEAKTYWRTLSDRDRDSDNMTGKSVLEHALLKMRRGKVSPHDVEDLLGPVNAAFLAWEEIERDASTHQLSTPERPGTARFPSGQSKGWDPGF